MQTPSAHKGWTLAISSLGLFMVALDTLGVILHGFEIQLYCGRFGFVKWRPFRLLSQSSSKRTFA